MNIGIIGSGNMGASMGKAWAAKGHRVLFSFSHEAAKLRAVTEAAGPVAKWGTPAEAVAFGDVILLVVPLGRRHRGHQGRGRHHSIFPSRRRSRSRRSLGPRLT
ncbi:MAG: NAD(P)-binding domain-containing protein [Methylocella sp.]